MTDRELGALQFAVWAFLLYCLVLAVVAVWRRFIRNGDVVAEAEAVRVKAELALAEVMADHASIKSFVADWMPMSRKVAIAEAIVVDRQRDHR